jgi:NADPH:quinone reductase-like Zn-dependent oxidoreductase
MKAAVHTSYGPPDVVRIAEVEKPAAKDNQVLVKVHATTVNRTDCGMRAARPFFIRLFAGLTRPRLTVLGNEFAGEVEAVGRGVTSFTVGDRVFGFEGSRFGAHAGYLAVPEDGFLATVPAGLTYEEVAPSTEGSLYAQTLIGSAKVRRGYDVLVNGATGAIGSAAVQLLHGLGAHRVIDYTAQDFITDDQTYDVVLDAVGKSSFGRCRRLLRPKGCTSRRTWARCPRISPCPWSRRCSAGGGSGSRSPHARPGAGAAVPGAARVGGVPAAGRPDLPAGRDRRGLPVRRDGSKARQRGDQRPASGPVTVMTTLPRPWPSTRCRMASGTSASG